MASLSIVSMSPLLSLTKVGVFTFKPSAASFHNNSSRKVSLCVNNNNNMSSGSRLLHCSRLTTSSTSFGSTFSGSSLGLDSSYGISVSRKRGLGFVVKAGKYSLAQTKRSRSRKSLARVHGFRERMSTTSGRAVLKRRRAKGRWVLCTKSNPKTGKRS